MARLPQSVNCQWISQGSIPHRCLPFHSYRRDKSCHSSRENRPASKTRTKSGSAFRGDPALWETTCCRAEWRNLSIVNIRLDLFALYKKVARLRSISTYFRRRYVEYTCYKLSRLGIGRWIFSSSTLGRENNDFVFVSLSSTVGNFILASCGNIAPFRNTFFATIISRIWITLHALKRFPHNCVFPRFALNQRTRLHVFRYNRFSFEI